jgi:hypothetical protein
MRRIAGIAALALALFAAGCGNRGGSLAGYSPEGLSNRAVLQTQVDEVNGALTVSAVVFVQVPTNRVRLYDDVNNAGYLPAGDYSIEPARVFSTGWAAYTLPLPSYDSTATHVLLARGSRDGNENSLSPLSNAATIPPGSGATLIAPRDTLPLAPRATVPHPDAAPTIHPDSLVFQIAAVAAAQRINLEVLFRGVTQYLVVFDRQPSSAFTSTVTFENVAPQFNQTYQWHVDEYDASSRLIAATTVNGSFVAGTLRDSANAYVWPTAASHFVFKPWTIP